MSIFSNQFTVLGTGVVSLIGLVWVVSGRNPFATLSSAVRTLAHDRRTLGYLLAIGLVLAVNSLQTKLAVRTHEELGWDFTATVSQYGTGIILALQKLSWLPLTQLFSYVYVILFPVLGIGSIFVYGAEGDWESLRRLIVGFLTNYVVALPFYTLTPVKEAWAAGMGIQFLIPQVFPAFDAFYRPMSGISNCFPSLHTSLSLTYALVAWRSGNRRLTMVLTAGSLLVMFSTLYLGVHWVLDMMAGIILALFAAGLVPLALPRSQEAQRRHAEL